jgi:ribosomal protein S18 acetylase RimI-like enzyme
VRSATSPGSTVAWYQTRRAMYDWSPEKWQEAVRHAHTALFGGAPEAPGTRVAGAASVSVTPQPDGAIEFRRVSDGREVGILIVKPDEDEDEDPPTTYYVAKSKVDKEYRRQGHGRALYDAAMDWAKENRVWVTPDLDISDDARRLWHRFYHTPGYAKQPRPRTDQALTTHRHPSEVRPGDEFIPFTAVDDEDIPTELLYRYRRAKKRPDLAPAAGSDVLTDGVVVEPESVPEVYRRYRSARSSVRLWRASDWDGVMEGYSFSPDRETAEAYLDNPGFGGPELYYTDVTPQNVYDTRGNRWAGAELGFDEDDAIYTVHESEWLGRYPKVLEALRAAGYDWFVCQDTFPDGAETWQWTGLGPEPGLVCAEEEHTAHRAGGDRVAAAVRMDPVKLREAEDIIRTQLSRVALGVVMEHLDDQEEFVADIPRRLELAETNVETVKLDIEAGLPTSASTGLSVPGALYQVYVTPDTDEPDEVDEDWLMDPESWTGAWRIESMNVDTGDTSVMTRGPFDEMNQRVLSLAEAALESMRGLDIEDEEGTLDWLQSDLTGLQKHSGGIPARLPLEVMMDLGTLNGVRVGEVPVTFKESPRVGGTFYMGKQPSMVLRVGTPPRTRWEVESLVPRLVSVFEHEAVHGFQNERGYKDKTYRGGMWSSSFDGVNDTGSHLTDAEHAQADVEFYPRIVSEVHAFLQSRRVSNEAAHKWVEQRTTFTALRAPADKIFDTILEAVSEGQPPYADEMYASFDEDEDEAIDADAVLRWVERRASENPVYRASRRKWAKAVKLFFQEINKASAEP